MDSSNTISNISLKDTLLKFCNSAKKDDEIEIGFLQNQYKISLEKYIVLLKYFAMMSKTHNYKIVKEDTLNVSYNYDYEDYNNYRITVHGLENINSKLNAISHRENHVIFSILFSQFLDKDNNDKLTAMNKIKEKKNMIDIGDYGVRVRLSKEKDINKMEHDNLLKMSETERKFINFRFIQRVSLIIEDNKDYIIRIDLSQVKSSNKVNLLEKNTPNIELEIDVSFKNQVSDKKQINKIVEHMETQLLNLQKILQKSNIVVVKSENLSILDRFKKLVFGEQESNIKDLPAMQSQAAEIPHIVDIIPNKYTVTDKADGERYFLVILDGNIYLISNTMEIKQLENKYFKNIEAYNNTILDGEYIFVSTKQKFIYLAFDCLFFKGQDMRPEAKLSIRLDKVKECTKELFKQTNFVEQYSEHFDVDKLKKHHTTGLQKYMDELNKKLDDNKTGPNIVLLKYFVFPLGVHSCEVYLYSSMIWELYTKTNKLNSPYVLDGIIYTPLEQVYTRNLRETKYRIYKWKPASKNSLDFYVEYERHKETKQILNVYDDSKSYENSIETENMSLDKLENTYVVQDDDVFKKKGSIYRILNLHVGKNEGGKEYPILFQREQGNYIANIYINTKNDDKIDEARDVEGNMIQDKTVVEFIYQNDPRIPAGFRWIPLRTRYDKTEFVNTYKKKYGNNSEIAEKTWRSIMDGVEISDIELLGNPDTYDNHNKKLKSKITSEVITMERRENAYYQVITNLAKPLREFHNYIKSILLYTYCAPKKTDKSIKKLDVLDMACGVGGDILKMFHTRINSLVGFDIDYNNIFSGTDGALSRYQDSKKKFPHFPEMTFLVADGGSLLTVEDQMRALGTMTDQNKQLIKKFFDTDKPKQYDVISCQFAVHYFFKSDITLSNFLANVKKMLKPSGYLLMTTFDGNVVDKSFDETNRVTSYYTTNDGKKKIIFDVVKKYDDNINLNRTGIMIDVHLPVFEEDVYETEYLVTPEFMIKNMKTIGLRLVETDLFGHVFEKNKSFFEGYAKDEEINETRKWFMKVKEYYNQEDPMNKSCFSFTKLSRYYVFQKEDNTK